MKHASRMGVGDCIGKGEDEARGGLGLDGTLPGKKPIGEVGTVDVSSSQVANRSGVAHVVYRHDSRMVESRHGVRLA